MIVVVVEVVVLTMIVALRVEDALWMVVQNIGPWPLILERRNRACCSRCSVPLASTNMILLLFSHSLYLVNAAIADHDLVSAGQFVQTLVNMVVR